MNHNLLPIPGKRAHGQIKWEDGAIRWLVALAGLFYGTATMAEVTEVRIGQQYSMGYLQFDVMRHRKLLQGNRVKEYVTNA